MFASKTVSARPVSTRGEGTGSVRGKTPLRIARGSGPHVVIFAALLPASCALALAQAPTGGAAAAAKQPESAAVVARADLGPARDLVRASQFEQAEKLLSEAQQSYPDDASLLLLRGEVLNQLQRSEQAVDVLRHAVEVAPEKLRAHFALGTALSLQGNATGALEAFAKEIEINQDAKVQVLARLNRSILFQKNGNLAEAASELEQVIALEPTNSQAHGDLADLYLSLGRTDDAARLIDEASAAGLRSARLHYRAGVAYYNQKAFDKAILSFQKAVEIQPDLADAELNIARSYDRLGKTEDANAHLRRFLELRPDAPEAAEIRKRTGAAAKGTRTTKPTK